MNYYIKSIAPIRAAVCAAIVGFLLSYPAIGLMYVFAQFAARPNTVPFPQIYLISIPLMVVGFILIFVALAAASYNALARFGLGIKVRMAPNPTLNPDAPPSGDAPVS